MKDKAIAPSVLRERLESDFERCETVRAALELAGIPFDQKTRRALSDLAVTYERVLDESDEDK